MLHAWILRILAYQVSAIAALVVRFLVVRFV